MSASDQPPATAEELLADVVEVLVEAAPPQAEAWVDRLAAYAGVPLPPVQASAPERLRSVVRSAGALDRASLGGAGAVGRLGAGAWRSEALNPRQLDRLNRLLRAWRAHLDEFDAAETHALQQLGHSWAAGPAWSGPSSQRDLRAWLDDATDFVAALADSSWPLAWRKALRLLPGVTDEVRSLASSGAISTDEARQRRTELSNLERRLRQRLAALVPAALLGGAATPALAGPRPSSPDPTLPSSPSPWRRLVQRARDGAAITLATLRVAGRRFGRAAVAIGVMGAVLVLLLSGIQAQQQAPMVDVDALRMAAALEQQPENCDDPVMKPKIEQRIVRYLELARPPPDPRSTSPDAEARPQPAEDSPNRVQQAQAHQPPGARGLARQTPASASGSDAREHEPVAGTPAPTGQQSPGPAADDPTAGTSDLPDQVASTGPRSDPDANPDAPPGRPELDAPLEPGPEDDAVAEASFDAILDPAQRPESHPGELPTEVALKDLAPMRFVRVPAGSFHMGSPPSEHPRFANEGPVHRVSLDAFWISTTEVTQEQWRLVTGSEPPSLFRGDDLPVESISWCEALRFANLMSKQEGRRPAYDVPRRCHKGAPVRWDPSADGYRLPTEAEWEYAARAGSSGPWWSGEDASDLLRVAWVRLNSGSRTHAVGTRGANAWELADMMGNVYEWAWGDLPAYDARPGLDRAPRHLGGHGQRTYRGGSWNSPVRGARAAFRDGFHPSVRDPDIGFRLVRSGR